LTFRWLMLTTSLLLPTSALCASRGHSTACPVTKGNGYPPPGEPQGPDRYGSRALSTILYPEGTVTFCVGGPGFLLADGSLEMKFPWWKETRDKLSIMGRRLDATAPPLRSDVGESTDFHRVPTYIIFPTTGCWEVTGKAGKAKLVFVTRVVKIGAGP